MNFHKIVFAIAFLGIVAGGFLVNAQPAQAATVEELVALIAQLKAQILQLQQQLAATQGQPAAWCHDFNVNLRIGDTGSEVLELKTALIKDGVWPFEAVTNEFDEETASYIVAFQEKYKSEILAPFRLSRGTGFAGKGTRAKLNALYGCGVVVQPPTPAPTPIPPIPSLTPLPIIPSIMVFSPGGETWATGSSQTIKWSASSTIKQVSISLSPAISSPRWSSIAPPLANSGSYTWIVDTQGRESGPYVLQICGYLTTDAALDEPSVCVQSKTFSIVGKVSLQPSITVLSPNGGETLQKGSTTYIKLKFSPSVPLGGFVINLLESNADIAVAHLKECGTGQVTQDSAVPPNVSFQWKVGYNSDGKEISTGLSGSSYRVLVYDCGSKIDNVWTGSSVTAKSNIFSIVSSLKATDSDNSPDYTFGVASYSITPQKYPDLFVAGVGKGDYTGGGPCIYGTEPNPTSCKPTSDNFTTYYDHCFSSTQLNEAFVNSSGKLGALGVSPPSGYECRNGAFISIQQPSITVLSPNGVESFTIGQTYDITWKYSGPTDKLIQLELGLPASDGPLIATNVLATSGRYSWTVPSTTAPRTDYRIIVREPSPSYTLLDSSDAYFSIVSASTATPSITVLSPNGGENWVFGNIHTITWQSSGVQTAYVYLQFPDGVMCKITEASAQYRTIGFVPQKDMQCPGISRTLTAGQYKVALYGESETVKDFSDNYLSIVSSTVATPSIAVLSPNGGESFTIGQTYDITWRFSGPADKLIQLELGLPASDGPLIATNVLASSGRYSWTVPLTLTPRNDYRIIIREPSSSYTFLDSSDNYLSIVPFLNVLSPNGGEQWVVGSTQTIKWFGVSTGNIALIALKGELGGQWDLAYNTPNDSSETLTVPNVPPGRYKISLNTDLIAGKIVEDQSDDYFTIVSSGLGVSAQEQIASIADAVSRLLQSFEEFKKSNP